MATTDAKVEVKVSVYEYVLNAGDRIEVYASFTIDGEIQHPRWYSISILDLLKDYAEREAVSLQAVEVGT